MAVMEKLYPPTIDSSIPAFCDDNGTVIITVPFTMNRAVSTSQISGFALKIKSAQSNTYITTLTSTDVIDAITNKSISFSFGVSNYNANTQGARIRIGQFLKFQLAYISISGVTGYFSTVAVGKYTAKPQVQIKEYSEYPDRILNFEREYTGEYILSSLDKTERPYSYKFTLYNQYMEVEETSDWKPHNSTLDVTNLDSTIDTYTFGRGLNESQTYYLQYSVRTINDLVVTSPLYSCAAITVADSRISDIDMIAENNFEEGYINLSFENTSSTPWSNASGALSILIERTDSMSNFTLWNTIKKVYFSSKAAISSWFFRDMTVEQGVSYQYRFGLYDSYGNQSNQSRSEIVTADFEDMFLYDGKKQVKIRFNPKVSSFKETILESKVDTIGSKYPYVFRNKIVGYKEFPIGGLISYLADNNEMFLRQEEYEIQAPSEYKLRNILRYSSITVAQVEALLDEDADNIEILFYDDNGLKKPLTNEILEEENVQDYIFYKQEHDIITYTLRTDTPEDQTSWPEKLPTTLPYGYNMRAERQFKMQLLDWLNDGQIKLFRSPAEGSYLVRLMNVSLTPEDRLGRMIHSFQAQAYEMAELNYNNLLKYGFLHNKEEESIVFSMYEDSLTDNHLIPGTAYFKCNSRSIWDKLTIDLTSASNQGSFGGLYFRLGVDAASKFYVQNGTTMDIEMQINETHVLMPDLYFFEEDNIPSGYVGNNIASYNDLLEGSVIQYWCREVKVLSGDVEENNRKVKAIYRQNRSYNIYGLISSVASSSTASYYKFDSDATITSGSNVYQFSKLLTIQFHQRVEMSGYTYQDNTLSYNNTTIPTSNYDRTVIYVTTNNKKYIIGSSNTLIEITNFGDDQIVINEGTYTAPPQGLSLLQYQLIDLSNAPRYYCTIIQQEKVTEFES